MSKVTLIGAGSVLWTPKILGDFYVMASQPIDEICLMDINPDALEPVIALAELMEKKTGKKFKLTTETELERSVQSSSFVVVSIAAGGLKAMESDLSIPEDFGVLATVGDTVGPSGHSRLLRNAPVFLDMARRIEKVSPHIWFINVSNPLTALTRLINQQTSLKTLGLCSGILNHIWILKDLLGFDEFEDVDFTVGGIDHCSWFLKLIIKNKDIYPELRRLSLKEMESRVSFLLSKDEWANLDSLTAGFTLFKTLGYLPAISDRHLCEFFPFFISSKENLSKYNIKRTSINHRQLWGNNAKKVIKEILKGDRELMLSKSRDIVVDVINSLAGAGDIETTINYPNEGQIENLPAGSVVETKGHIRFNQIVPEYIGSLPEQLLSIIQPHIVRQELVLRASMEGSRSLFKAALVSDPNIKELEGIDELIELLLEANKDYLPQFFDQECL